MSDQLSRPVRTVPFTDLFRHHAAPVAAPQTPETGVTAARAAAFAKGQAEARAEAADALASQAAAHSRAIATMEARAAAATAALAATNEQTLQALETAYAESLASLAIAIARTIIAAQPALAAETLQSLLREALAALPEGSVGTLFLAPDAPPPAVPSGWRIIADAALAPGALRARVDAAVVTASLERRLAQLESTLG